MSDLSHQPRKIRQTLAIDALLGMDGVPLGKPPEPPEPPAHPEVSADQHRLTSASSPAPAVDIQSMMDIPHPTADAWADAPVGDDLSPDQKQALLDDLNRQYVSGCTKCELCRERKNTVFGVGHPDADLMFVGEGPGRDEDEQGEPFVGRAGQLLDKQIAAMRLSRADVYIANIVKCRPPGNRVPTPDEADQCVPYLLRQIQIIQPKVIVGLGATAVKYLLNDPRIAITRTRGQWRKFHDIDFMPTFHPAYLLRQYTTENRQRVWSDLQAVMAKLGI